VGRIKYILLFVLLFAVSASAQISPRLDSLGYRVMWRLGMPEDGTDLIDTNKIDDAVNAGIYQTCKDYPALPKYDTVYISSSVEGGALNSDFDRIDECYIIYGDTLRYPLVFITADSMRKILPTLESNVQKYNTNSAPLYYSVTDTTLFVYPKWRFTDSVKIFVKYYAIDTALTAATSATSIAPEYRIFIIYYACATIEQMRSNLDRADFWQKRYGK
jgi:hypothetical protein